MPCYVWGWMSRNAQPLMVGPYSDIFLQGFLPCASTRIWIHLKWSLLLTKKKKNAESQWDQNFWSTYVLNLSNKEFIRARQLALLEGEVSSGIVLILLVQVSFNRMCAINIWHVNWEDYRGRSHRLTELIWAQADVSMPVVLSEAFTKCIHRAIY